MGFQVVRCEWRQMTKWQFTESQMPGDENGWRTHFPLTVKQELRKKYTDFIFFLLLAGGVLTPAFSNFNIQHLAFVANEAIVGALFIQFLSSDLSAEIFIAGTIWLRTPDISSWDGLKRCFRTGMGGGRRSAGGRGVGGWSDSGNAFISSCLTSFNRTRWDSKAFRLNFFSPSPKAMVK